MVYDISAVMIDEPLVVKKSERGAPEKQFIHLHEMMNFFYNHANGYEVCPGFRLGKKRYLSQCLKNQYWFGIKAAVSGHGTKYLQQVYRLQKRYGYYGTHGPQVIFGNQNTS